MSIIESLADNLTPKQETTLKEFRENVGDVLHSHHDDFFLLRWLQARNFDVAKAEKMLRKSLTWRRNYGTDDILAWEPPEILKKYWPGGIFGFDKLGHPILWQLSSNFDGAGMMKSVKRSDVIKYHIWRMEKLNFLCREQSKKSGRRIGCSVHISDLHGFSLKMVFSPGITDIMKEVFALTEANYPENLYSSYVINAPGAFAIFFNILRPFLSEATKRKVHMCGRNWRDRLKEAVDPDELPVHWGGTAAQPDDTCTDHINLCQPIPDEYYVRDKVLLNKESMIEVTIPRGGDLQLKYQVTRPGSVIRWVFETEHYDIAYGISCKLEQNEKCADDKSTKVKVSKEGSTEEIRQISRVNSQTIPEDGNITCHKPGIYIFTFDNSYSWVHSKHLHYEVEMLPPVRDSIVFRGFSIDDDEISETTRL